MENFWLVYKIFHFLILQIQEHLVENGSLKIGTSNNIIIFRNIFYESSMFYTDHEIIKLWVLCNDYIFYSK